MLRFFLILSLLFSSSVACAQRVLKNDEYRVVLANVLAASATERQYFVAPNGSDVATGTFLTPFASIANARDAIAAIKPLTKPVTVYVRGGVYRTASPIVFDSGDSGTEAFPIVYRSFPGETAVIRGSIKATGTWVTHSGSIKYLSLPGQADFRELWVGGKRAIRARTPNVGSYHLMEDDATIPNKDYFKPKSPDVNGNVVSGHTEVCTYCGFIQDRHLFGSYQSSNTQLHTLNKSRAGFNFRQDYGRYFFENELAFLDQAGEWYWDGAADRLYYWPRAGEVLGTTDVEIPVVSRVLSVEGALNTLPVTDVDFTVAFRFKTSTGSGYRYIFGNNFAGTGWQIGIRNAGGNDGCMFVLYDAVNTDFTTLPNLSNNAWHTVVWSVNYGAKTYALYVDGSQVGTTINFGAQNVLSTAPTIAGLDIGTNNYAGLLDDIVVLDDDVSGAGEVSAIGTKDYSAFNVLAKWNFDKYSFDVESPTMRDVVSYQLYEFGGGVKKSQPTLVDDGAGGFAASFNGTSDILSTQGVAGTLVDYLTFQDLEIAHADAPAMGTYTLDSVTSSTYSTYGDIYNTYFGSNSGVYLFCSDEIRFLNCDVHDVGGTGIYSDRSRHTRVEGSRIYNCGYMGFAARGGFGITSPDLAGGHSIIASRIHDVGQMQRNAFALHLEYGGDCRVLGNVIYNSPCGGVRSYGMFNSLLQSVGNTEVAYNVIHDCMQELHDSAGYMQSGSQRGTNVHHNRIYNLPFTSLHVPRTSQTLAGSYEGGHGVYLDEGSQYSTIKNNLIYRLAGHGVFLHLANNCTIENNVIHDAEICLQMTSRGLDYSGDGSTNVYPTSNTFRYNILSPVKGFVVGHTSTSSTYSLTTMAGIGTWNNNLWAKDLAYQYYDSVGSPSSLSFATWKSQYSVDGSSALGNPLFVDQARDDYRVQPASPARALGFLSFDVPDEDAGELARKTTTINSLESDRDLDMRLRKAGL